MSEQFWNRDPRDDKEIDKLETEVRKLKARVQDMQLSLDGIIGIIEQVVLPTMKTYHWSIRSCNRGRSFGLLENFVKAHKE